jgi:hypothetical protein
MHSLLSMYLHLVEAQFRTCGHICSYEVETRQKWTSGLRLLARSPPKLTSRVTAPMQMYEHDLQLRNRQQNWVAMDGSCISPKLVCEVNCSTCTFSSNRKGWDRVTALSLLSSCRATVPFARYVKYASVQRCYCRGLHSAFLRCLCTLVPMVCNSSRLP